MKLGEYGAAEVHRERKMLIVRFNRPHRVISTCRVNGGIHEDLECLFNHQSCEPAGHSRKELKTVLSAPERYLQGLCERFELPEKTASLGTAANMNYAAIETKSFKNLEVTAICTGGVEGNAGRVGDPASVWEQDGVFEPLEKGGKELHGTINTMLLINRELTRGAMVRTIMTATEAKTAVLQELAVSSRYSDGLATGTGTDQIAVACALTGDTPLTSAGKHAKLGELIGSAVSGAIRKTLALQNSLTPGNQRSILEHIKRFGAGREHMTESIARRLQEETAAVFRRNFNSLDRDPVAVGASCSLVHARDKVAWGILPQSCMKEIFVMHGAQLATGISHRVERYADFSRILSLEPVGMNNHDFLEFVYASCALGYSEKWKD